MYARRALRLLPNVIDEVPHRPSDAGFERRYECREQSSIALPDMQYEEVRHDARGILGKAANMNGLGTRGFAARYKCDELDLLADTIEAMAR